MNTPPRSLTYVARLLICSSFRLFRGTSLSTSASYASNCSTEVGIMFGGTVFTLRPSLVSAACRYLALWGWPSTYRIFGRPSTTSDERNLLLSEKGSPGAFTSASSVLGPASWFILVQRAV